MGNQNTGFMEDVCYIRLLLIVLLVIYHAFAIHSGAWNPIGEQIALYGWLDKFAYSFMLECFVFISGYVYGMQVRNGKEIKLLPEVKRKAKRLWTSVVSSDAVLVFYVYHNSRDQAF